jgi:hypothetical protein
MEEEFVPLRKRLKSVHTNNEENFMGPYYTPTYTALQNQISISETVSLRELNQIEVQSNCPCNNLLLI